MSWMDRAFAMLQWEGNIDPINNSGFYGRRYYSGGTVSGDRNLRNWADVDKGSPFNPNTSSIQENNWRAYQNRLNDAVYDAWKNDKNKDPDEPFDLTKARDKYKDQVTLHSAEYHQQEIHNRRDKERREKEAERNKREQDEVKMYKAVRDAEKEAKKNGRMFTHEDAEDVKETWRKEHKGGKEEEVHKEHQIDPQEERPIVGGGYTNDDEVDEGEYGHVGGSGSSNIEAGLMSAIVQAVGIYDRIYGAGSAGGYYSV